jgi:hypothetical protein
MIDHYGEHRPHPATAGPVPVERMIDHYGEHRPHPATAGPVPVERMIDHYGERRPHPATAGPVPVEQCELRSPGMKTTSGSTTVSPAIDRVLRSPARPSDP